MVAPVDPGVRAARVGGFIFGEWDSGPRGESRHKPDRWGANGQDPCVPSLSPREERSTPVGVGHLFRVRNLVIQLLL